MTKVLVDAGQVIAKVEASRGASGMVEYGSRDNKGTLHTSGIAQIVSVSEAKKAFGLNDEWLRELPTRDI